MALRISIGLALLFMTVLNYTCNSNIPSTVSINEIKRLPSNDHQVDAVLITTEVDATTSTAYHLFIVKSHAKITAANLNEAVFTCDHESKLNIKWAENKKLIISYDNARIFTYTNFWNSTDIDKFNYVVEIFLNCMSPDHQLSDHDRHL